MSMRGPGDSGDPLEFLGEPTESEELRKKDLQHLKRIRRARQVRLARAGVIAAVLLLLIVFVVQNDEPVPVRLLSMSGRPLLIWVIVLSAALGAVVGYLVGKPTKATRIHEPTRAKGRARKR
jgi:uncharacterized integral membrane protein